MKNFFALLCVILSVIACAQGEDDEFSASGCKIDGKLYKAGEKYTKPGECNLYTCHGSKGVSGVTCGAVGVLPPCRLTDQDNSKSYPECCPKVVC